MNTFDKGIPKTKPCIFLPHSAVLTESLTVPSVRQFPI